MDGTNTPNLCYHAYIKGLCVYMYTLVKSNYVVNIIGTCTCMFQESKGSCFASANLMMLNPSGNRNMNSTRLSFIHDFFLGGGKDCMGRCGWCGGCFRTPFVGRSGSMPPRNILKIRWQ